MFVRYTIGAGCSYKNKPCLFSHKAQTPMVFMKQYWKEEGQNSKNCHNVNI